MARGNAAARGAGLQPAGHMRFILECLFWPSHRDARGQIAMSAIEKSTCHIVVLLQLGVEHPIQLGGFLGVSVLGVGQILTHKRGVFVEVVILPCHGAKPTHLPHWPLIDGQLVAIGCAIECPCLARQILQDGAAFKEGERRAVGAVMIDNSRHAVVGLNFQEIGIELLTFADVHQLRGVGKVHFLKRNCDFPSIRCGPVVKIDHRTCPIAALGQYSGYRFERKGQMGDFDC